MGVKISQLPVAASVASDDYIPVLDTSESVLKRTPISHASSSTTYGSGTTSNYGHVKLRDDLTRTSYTSGEALSSYQGNVLAKDIGPLETGNTATAAHAKDSYFVWKGQFVKATAAIASGATIASGTNVTSTNVSAVLSELNSKIGGTTIVTKPTVTVGTYTYNGNSQGPTITWSVAGMDEYCTITNATQVNAGTYTLTIALNDVMHMVWNDLTTASLTYTYTINKKAGSVSISPSSATLNSSTTSKQLTITANHSATITVSSSNTACATVSPTTLTGSGTVTVTSTGVTGDVTITASLASSANYTSATGTSAITCSFVPLKTFAAATDDEIAQMVAAADAGQIDLYSDCGWRVGQEHTVSLAAIAASGSYDGVSWSVGESQSAQTVTLVLMHQGGYQLVNSVKSKGGATRTTCSFIVGLKNGLDTRGYMNSSDTNTGSWNGSARRNWCNGGFRQAIPSVLRAAFKQFKTITAQTYNGSTNQTSNDYFALPAAAEVFKGDSSYGQGGSAGAQTGYSNLTEFNALTRFTWYETTSNRVKKQGDSGSAYDWWERSPYYSASSQFCCVSGNGNASDYRASTAYLLSPFGCL